MVAPMRVMNRVSRMKKSELEGLIQARKRLDAAYDAIATTNLGMKPMLMHELEEVARVIDAVLGRHLARVQQLLNPQAAAEAESAPGEPAARDPAADQAEKPQRESEGV